MVIWNFNKLVLWFPEYYTLVFISRISCHGNKINKKQIQIILYSQIRLSHAI